MSTELTVVEKLNGIALKKDSGFMQALEQSLPQHSPILAPALVRGALAAIKASEALQKCSEFSLFCSIAEVAQTGLSLDVHLGQAFLVPFSNIATVMYGYRGLCELARRSGEIGEIVGEIRYEKDEWQIKLGTERELVHVPFDGPTKDRGKMLGAYAVAVLKDGDDRRFEYMTADQIEKIKSAVLARKKSGKPSPWETNEDEMWRKTPIRRLAKRLPQSPALLTFISAAIRDEYRQQGHLNGGPPMPQVEKILEAEGIVEEPLKVDTVAMPKPVRGKKAKAPKARSGAKPSISRASVGAQDSTAATPTTSKPSTEKGPITQNQYRDLLSWLGEHRLDATNAAKIARSLGYGGPVKELPAALLPKVYEMLEKSTKE